MSTALPIADEDGEFEYRTVNGQEYIKVYDFVHQRTGWQPWNPIISPAASMATTDDENNTSGPPSLLDKLSNLASAFGFTAPGGSTSHEKTDGAVTTTPSSKPPSIISTTQTPQGKVGGTILSTPQTEDGSTLGVNSMATSGASCLRSRTLSATSVAIMWVMAAFVLF